MSIQYFYSSVSSNLELKKHQQKIEMIFDSKKIPYEKFDVAADESIKNKMRDIAKDPKALPPQLAKDDVYLGNFEAFEAAVEEDTLNDFLKM